LGDLWRFVMHGPDVVDHLNKIVRGDSPRIWRSPQPNQLEMTWMLTYVSLALGSWPCYRYFSRGRPPCSRRFRIARSTTIAAPAFGNFPSLNDLHAWRPGLLSEKIDPAMKRTYEGPVRESALRRYGPATARPVKAGRRLRESHPQRSHPGSSSSQASDEGLRTSEISRFKNREGPNGQ